MHDVLPGHRDPLKFYLGCHQPGWLRFATMPLFVSRTRLIKYKRLPVAGTSWALDSGAFTELEKHGEWSVSPKEYAAEVLRFQTEIGRMDWAAIQDWICAPDVLKKTGLTVKEHQARTLKSFIHLRKFAPSIPWVPVLQGFGVDDYVRHADQHEAHGIELAREPIVGLGSVVRKTGEALHAIVKRLADRGLSLHGFGVKKSGLPKVQDMLTSADSMAWSYDARRAPALDGCEHASCANCYRYASGWYDSILAIESDPQLRFDF